MNGNIKPVSLDILQLSALSQCEDARPRLALPLPAISASSAECLPLGQSPCQRNFSFYLFRP